MPIQLSGSLVITGSITTTGGITISGSILSASYSDTASFSNNFRVLGNLTASTAVITGTLTAQTLVVQTVTSSIVYSSGSNIFGSQITDRQTFTGSLNVTGSSHTIYGSMGIGTTNPFVFATGQTIAGTGIHISSSKDGTGTLALDGSTQSQVLLNANGAIANNRLWRIYTDGGTFRISSMTDAIGVTSNVIYLSGSNNIGLFNQTPRTVSSLKTLESVNWLLEDNGAFGIKNNAYYNGTNNLYITSTTAERIYISAGFHYYDAPSGTAGNAATFTERFTIANGGSVGIGITTPASKLHIYKGVITGSMGKMSDAALLIDSVDYGNNTYNAQIAFGYYSSTWTYAPIAIGFIPQNGSGAGYADLTFNTRSTGTDVAPSERMRITSAGNVGIGSTSNTAYKFIVDNGGANKAAMFGTDSMTYTATLNAVSTNASISAARFYLNAASSTAQPALVVDKYDNNTTTSQIFQWFSVNNQNTGCGQINANGASQAAFGTFSDSRLKENITNLPNQLSNITSLRPVEFDYKDGSGHQIGFIAQEMQEIYPEAVSEAYNGYLTVTGWSKTEAYLVKAIQELSAKVTALETK